MTKKNQSQRDISFLSGKNGKVVTVHSALARQVAKCLETDSRVFSYQVDVPLTNIPETISVVGLRETYLTTEPNCCERTSLFPQYGSKDHSSGNRQPGIFVSGRCSPHECPGDNFGAWASGRFHRSFYLTFYVDN